MFVIIYLDYFTQHNIFKLHSCCNMSQCTRILEKVQEMCSVKTKPIIHGLQNFDSKFGVCFDSIFTLSINFMKYVYIHILLTHCSVSGQLGCFYPLTIVNNLTMNTVE